MHAPVRKTKNMTSIFDEELKLNLYCTLPLSGLDTQVLTWQETGKMRRDPDAIRSEPRVNSSHMWDMAKESAWQNRADRGIGLHVSSIERKHIIHATIYDAGVCNSQGSSSRSHFCTLSIIQNGSAYLAPEIARPTERLSRAEVTAYSCALICCPPE